MRVIDPVAAAADLIARGLAVAPVPAGSRRPGPGWLSRATTRVQDLQDWAPGSGVAVACRPSGVVVLDLDHHPDVDGVQRLAWLAAAAGTRGPTTFAVVTPHGGLHLYFWAPPGTVIDSGSGAWSRLGPGIDVRAPGRRSGGYVLAPDIQTSVGTYRVAGEHPIVALPGWLTRILTGPTRSLPAGPADPGSARDREVRAAG